MTCKNCTRSTLKFSKAEPLFNIRDYGNVLETLRNNSGKIPELLSACEEYSELDSCADFNDDFVSWSLEEWASFSHRMIVKIGENSMEESSVPCFWHASIVFLEDILLKAPVGSRLRDLSYDFRLKLQEIVHPRVDGDLTRVFRIWGIPITILMDPKNGRYLKLKDFFETLEEKLNQKGCDVHISHPGDGRIYFDSMKIDFVTGDEITSTVVEA